MVPSRWSRIHVNIRTNLLLQIIGKYICTIEKMIVEGLNEVRSKQARAEGLPCVVVVVVVVVVIIIISFIRHFCSRPTLLLIHKLMFFIYAVSTTLS